MPPVSLPSTIGVGYATQCEDAASFTKHRHIFVIRVENINTLMSLACFQSLTRRSELLRRCLFSLFPVLLVQPSRETRGQFWSQFFVSPLSRQVLNTCVINVDLCFVLLTVCADQVQDTSSIRTDCVTSGVLSPVHTSTSVVKCFLPCPQNLFKSCPLVSPSSKSAASSRIHSYFIRWCCSPGYLAPCPLGKFCQETQVRLSRSEARESAHSEQANPCVSLPRPLRHSGTSNSC